MLPSDAVADMSVERLPIVGVMGSAREPHAQRAQVVGRWLAGEGVHLLTGGGPGVMSAVAEAFAKVPGRRGHVLGILPGGREGAGPRPGYPNPWVEIAIATHLPLSGERGTEPLSRNHITVLSSDVVVALPGGAGTASEVSLALRYRRPLVAYLAAREQIEGLPAQARVESNFDEIKAFVRAQLRR